jgi:hypothetical protein
VLACTGRGTALDPEPEVLEYPSRGTALGPELEVLEYPYPGRGTALDLELEVLLGMRDLLRDLINGFINSGMIEWKESD